MSTKNVEWKYQFKFNWVKGLLKEDEKYVPAISREMVQDLVDYIEFLEEKNKNLEKNNGNKR